MEKFMEYRDRSRQNIRVADHMLTMTYPLVKDPKLLLAVLENLFMAITNSMAAVLYYERIFKRVPPFHDTFESKFNLFKTKIVPRHKIDLKWVRFIAEVKEYVQEHKESTTEFPRKDKFIMADHNYRMKALDERLLKQHLSKTKELVHLLLQLVSKNDAMFGRR
ncbi:hypothetical protein JXA12_02395 [Candidatus Woesearchaeota archaeon]|nr:hypothetical protein [Candidatus Woesearchaeota archaeon]